MIVLTGGAGFIGSAFLHKLNSEGLTEISIVDSVANSEKWKNFIGKNFKSYFDKTEFIDLVRKDKLPFKVSAIIHMGACSSTTETDLEYLKQNNLEYTKTLARHSLEKDIRFIYASSAATYGDGLNGFSDDYQSMQKLKPLNPYGQSKQDFDLWAHGEGILDKIVGLKFFNVFGPNEYHKGEMRSVVNKAFWQIKQEGLVKLFKSHREGYQDGEQKRDFVYVKDCCSAMHWLLENKEVNGIYNLGTGKARTWKDLVSAIFSALSLEQNIKYIDMPEQLREQYQYFTEAEMEKLEKSGCPLNQFSLETAVDDYVNNYLEQYWPYL